MKHKFTCIAVMLFLMGTLNVFSQDEREKHLLWSSFNLSNVMEEVEQPERPSDLRAITDVEVLATSDYEPGETGDVFFSLSFGSPDDEFADGFEMTFPAGLVPVAASSIGGMPFTLIDGQTVAWGDIPGGSGWGYITPGTYAFSVSLAADASISGDQVADWTIHGDEWDGAGPPHVVSGTVIVSEGTLTPPPVVECPPGAIAESEPCGEDWNGGCNMDPGEETWEIVQPGDIICGTLWAEGNSRDTDWFEMELDDFYHVVIHADAEAPMFVFRLSPTNCADVAVVAEMTAGPFDPNSLDLGVLPAGTYWFWTGLTVFEGWPCDVNYVIEFEATPASPLVGNDCVTPIIVDEFPFQDLGQTTCGMGNNYAGQSTCLGNYGNGEDIHYQFTLTEEQFVTITMDPKGTTWTGILLTDECPPPAANCIATVTGSDGNPRVIEEVLQAGTYYIMISTWPSPACIPDFDLTITVSADLPPPSYCDAGPTTLADSNVEQVSISGENDTEIDHTGCDPAVTGVEDLTHLSVDLTRGETYTLEVTFGTCGGNFAGAGSVWIDWGQDFAFDPADLIHASTGTPGSAPWDGPVSISFTVPANAELGNTVMRVMQREGGSLPLDPCGTFPWGSVMDFGINVLEEEEPIDPPDPPELPGDLLFSQALYTDGSGSNSTWDSERQTDYEVADNFFGIGDTKGEAIDIVEFYGVYIDWDDFSSITPDETEPFFIRFYEYVEDYVPGLEAPETGTYEVQLLDEWGDGWAGDFPASGELYHTLSVFVNGVVVLDEITMLDGEGPDIHTFEAEAGDEITTVFTIDGAFAAECYYAIYDPSNNLIAEEGGTAASPGQSVPGNIEPGQVMALEPDWDNPEYEEYILAEAEYSGSDVDWLPGMSIWKFTAELSEGLSMSEGWFAPQLDADNASFGSGGWFFFWTALEGEGDGLAYQRDGTRNTDRSFVRGKQHPSTFLQNPNLVVNRDPVDDDFAFSMYSKDDDPVAVPVSNWAIFLGILLMISFVMIRFRRMI